MQRQFDGFLVTLLNEGEVIEHIDLGSSPYPVSKLWNILENRLNGLYFGSVDTILVERKNGQGS